MMRWLIVLLMTNICAAYTVTYTVENPDSNLPQPHNTITWTTDANGRFLKVDRNGWESYDGMAYRMYFDSKGNERGVQNFRPPEQIWRPFDIMLGDAKFAYASCTRKEAMKLEQFVQGNTWVVNDKIWSEWRFDDKGRLEKFVDYEGNHTATWSVLEWGKGYPKVFIFEAAPNFPEMKSNTKIYRVTHYQEEAVVPIRKFPKGTRVINMELGISYEQP